MCGFSHDRLAAFAVMLENLPSCDEKSFKVEK